MAPRSAGGGRGGAERAWEGLRQAIDDRTPHTAALEYLTVDERTLPGLVDGYRAFAGLDVSGFDLVVSSKYPAWLVDHPRHVVHMFHPLRGLYDTYDGFGLPPTCSSAEPSLRPVLDLVRSAPSRAALPQVFAAFDRAVAVLGPEHPELALPSPLAREVVRFLDRVALEPPGVIRHLALSATVARRPGYFPAEIIPRVVYLPADLPGLGPGDDRHLFTASRLDHPKRMDVVVGAMAHVYADIPLLIAGTGPEEARLRDLAGDDPRIRFLGPIGDHELARGYADALAVPFVPDDEDYGLITVEAFACETPVVTAYDSGGPTELVVHGATGLVTDPSPKAVGEALSRLVGDRAQARRLGRAGRDRGAQITWEGTVRAIVGPPSPTSSVTNGHRRSRPARRHPKKVAAVSTYAIHPARGGGQLRCSHLYGALARHVDVEVVCLVPPGGPVVTVEVSPALTQTTVPASAEQEALEGDESASVGLPVTDIVAGEVVRTTPAFLETLARACDGSDVALLAHPYLHSAVEAVRPDLPVVYDAHNHETALKRAVLPDTSAGRRLLDRVEAVERRATTAAALVVACSTEDANGLAAAYGRPAAEMVVIPNGTQVEARLPTPAERAGAGARWCRRYATERGWAGIPVGLAVYFASWHPPNLDAAEVIVATAPSVPEVVFALAGSHGSAFSSRVLPDNVVVAGVVPDHAKRSLLRAAAVALNPMRLGSGTNLKVIEYLAAGVPTVSTPFGVRGLDVDDRHVLLAETDRFGTAIRSILADPGAAAARAGAARELAAATYDWRHLGDRLAAALVPILT